MVHIARDRPGGLRNRTKISTDSFRSQIYFLSRIDSQGLLTIAPHEAIEQYDCLTEGSKSTTDSG